MNFVEVRDAIYTRFRQGWKVLAEKELDGEIPPQFYTNVDKRPSRPGPDYYVVVDLKDIFSDQRSMGQKGCRLFARNATLTIEVYTPGGIGAEMNDILAKGALDLFEGESLLGICFRRVRRVGIGATPGSRYQTNVLADIEYDERK